MQKIDSVTLTLTQAHTSKASFITPKRREIIGCYSNGEKYEVYYGKGLHIVLELLLVKNNIT